MSIIQQQRKSTLEINELYFWTATIHNWQNLLADDSFKMEVIDCLLHLKSKDLIEVYGFVIMPNHIHLIWKILRSNGKESPMGSLLKFTAHQFKKRLKSERPEELRDYYVGLKEKDYEFWQRDSLGIRLFTKDVILQKLEYIHKNPVSKKWNLAAHFDDYRFSSAKYYYQQIDEFSLLTNLQTIL